METPQIREKSPEGDHGDRVDSDEMKCQTCSTLQSSGNAACSTCSHGAESQPGSMDEIEQVASKVATIEHGCSAEQSSSDLDFGHDGPGGEKDNGDGDMGNNNATINSKGETDVVKKNLSETDRGDKNTGSPDNSSNKGGYECDVDHSSGTTATTTTTTTTTSATDESAPNLHRDNLLRMIASDSLSGQRPGQSQQEQDRAEEGNPDEDSCSVQPGKGKHNVEPLAVGNDAEDSSPVTLEKAKRGEEFQVPNIQQEGSGPIDLEKGNPEQTSPSTVNHPQDSNPKMLEKTKNDVESLARDNIGSAVNDSETAKGEGMEEMATAERPEAGSELEKQMMARLLEFESGPVAVKDEEESEEQAWTIGREWREWLWNCFLFLVVIFVMVMWNVDSSSASVAPTPATVQTPPASSTLSGAMNAMGTRMCSTLFNLEPTPRIGHASNEDSKGQTNNGSDKKTKTKHTKKKSAQNNSKNTSNVKNRKTNEEEGGRPAASRGKGQDKHGHRSSHTDQPKAQTKEERWRERWAAWALEFEELVDGPWV